MVRSVPQEPLAARGETVVPGRQPELRTISEAVEGALRGRGHVLLVAGEGGIGKTTLSEAGLQLAQKAGVRPLWGRAWESGGAPPLWPWIQVLREMVADDQGGRNLERLSPSHRRAIARLLPEIFSDEAGERQIETEEERFGLFDAVSRSLRLVSQETPLAIVLDDLHAADVASVLMLRFVARDIRAMRCLVMATYREAEARARSEVSEALRDTARDGTLIQLQGLEAADLGAVIESTLGMKPSDALLSAVEDLTNGNPFYVDEILRLMKREGSIEQRIDLTRSALPVPDSVSATVLRRVEPLPAETKDILRVAAVIGREFDDEVVARTMDKKPEDVRSALEIARAEDVIVRHATMPHRHLFAHALIRESLYEALSEEDRAAVHVRVATTLVELADPTTPAVAEIAHHFLAAGDLADARTTFDHARAAGSRAREVLAYEEAVDFYQRAIAVGDGMEIDAGEKGELLVDLGDALLRSKRYAEGKQVLWEAVDHGRRTGTDRALVAAALTLGYLPLEAGVVDHALIELCREALSRLGPEDDVSRALLMARMGVEYTFALEKERIEERDALVREAITLARRAGSKRDLGEVLRWSFGLLSPDTIEEYHEISREIRELGREVNEPTYVYSGTLRSLVYFIEFGRAKELSEGIESLATAARAARHPLAMWGHAAVRAMYSIMRGDFALGEQQATEALEVGSDFPNAIGANVIQTYVMRWEKNGAVDLLPMMQMGADLRPGIRHVWKSAEAALLARAGRTEEARTVLADVLERLPDAPKNPTWLVLHGCTGLASSLVGDEGGATLVYDRLLPYRGRNLHTTMGGPVVYWGSAELTLGMCAASLGRPEEALDHFEEALEMHGRLGARVYFARTQIELARTLVELGRDAERARQLLWEAKSIGEELELGALLEDVATLEETITATPSSVSPDAGRAERRGSMVAEGEFVTIASGDEVVRLRHSKGMGYLAALLAAPGRELHVLEVATPGTAETPAGAGELELGSDDLGAALDAKAKAAYKQRIDELRADIEEAESFNDPVRAANAKEELAFLTEQIAGAVGLGGRDRKTASNAERARVNVTKRIKTTIDKISAGAPKLGRHLEATIKTGTFLSYSDRIEPTLEWDIRLADPKP